MQNAKDTFYVTLRDRLAAVNPGRTVVVRGVTRPGVLVEENEMTSAMAATDVFWLRWVGLSVDAKGALPLVTMRCEVRYATDGSSGNGGMDRGRMLAAMDAELAAAVSGQPQNAVKQNFAPAAGDASAQPVAMGTKVFWGDVVFDPVVVTEERMSRVAAVEVWSYEEAGEI